jgi:hypothetical protein
MTIIPPRVMASVALDIFSMETAEYHGKTYDAFLLCVDRHSGWMVARPCTKDGLTGEVAAHLMLETSWGEFGIPSTIMSDQGPQFANAWWKTMCARLGIRQAFSQAHRPQANGRAEVAGKVVKDTMRRLLLDKTVVMTWVEALPRALRIYHDTVNPLTNMSPYQIVFGRTRAKAGLPWQPDTICEDAEDFFCRMDETDRKIAEILNEHHAKEETRINAQRHPCKKFNVGDWVWVRRPPTVGGVGLKSLWHGAYFVVAQNGENSYQVKNDDNTLADVHATQLAKCVWEPLGNLPGKH